MSDEAGISFTALYFGYASNLSKTTMKQRCPDSLYAGLGRLDGWKWFINETGYANIIPSESDVVYGGLFFLSNRDEAALDHSEGVPWMYEKHQVPIARMGAAEGQTVEAMTYVDIKRVATGPIEPDYIVWIHKAIKDGAAEGVPAEYIEKYIRPSSGNPPTEEQEITMIRTRMRPNAGSLLAQELQETGRKLALSGMTMAGATGRVRDGSTA